MFRPRLVRGSHDPSRKRNATNFLAEVERTKPNVEALLDVLNEHGVEYVVTGSAAALLHGVALEPGDLDITLRLTTRTSSGWVAPCKLFMRVSTRMPRLVTGRRTQPASTAGSRSKRRLRVSPHAPTGYRTQPIRRPSIISSTPTTARSTSSPWSAVHTSSLHPAQPAFEEVNTRSSSRRSQICSPRLPLHGERKTPTACASSVGFSANK